MSEQTNGGDTLAAAIARAEAAEFEIAWRDYPLLLRGTPDDKSVKRLREVMGILKKTAADAERDTQLLNEFVEVQSRVNSGVGIQPEISRLKAALAEYDADRQRKIQELNADRIKRAQAIEALECQTHAGDEARKRSRELLSANPRLLAGLNIVTA